MTTDSYPLPAGTVLPQGRIHDFTLTAYVVETPAEDFIFVPFSKVHPLEPVAPLVVFS